MTVGNANPSVAAAFAGAISCGGTGSLTVNFTDAGANDTHSASVDWGDGSAAQAVSSIASGDVLTHPYALAGMYNATVTVTDDDLGVGSDASNSVAQNYTVVGGGVQQPINQTGPMSIFKSKSTIPVKIAYLDCDGSPAIGLAPTINVQQLSGSVPSGSTSRSSPRATRTPARPCGRPGMATSTTWPHNRDRSLGDLSPHDHGPGHRPDHERRYRLQAATT